MVSGTKFRVAMWAAAAAVALLAPSLAAAQTKAPEGASHTPLLPASFAGFEAHGVKRGIKPADEAAVPSAVLQEFGLTDFQAAEYRREERVLKVRALRFADATGAFGMLSYMQRPGMARESLCDQAVSEQIRLLIRCANILLEVELDKVTAMTFSDLRQLAEKIPGVAGNTAELPKTTFYLPRELQAEARFALGPQAFAAYGSPVPAEAAGFDLSAEAAVVRFVTADGTATVSLFKYPTPKIARAQVERLETWKRSNAHPAEAERLSAWKVRRSGPLVAVVTGEIAETEAAATLERINYDADVTWNEATGLGQRDNIGNIVYVAILLSLLIFGVAVVVGVFYGGFRVAAKKYFPGRFVDKPEDVEFIRLKIDQ